MTQSPIVSLRNSITTQLLLVVLINYVVLTIVVGFMRLSADYLYNKKSLINELTVIEKTFGPGLAKAIWDMNAEQMESSFMGMFNMPSVVGVKIKSHKGESLAVIGSIINDYGKAVYVDHSGRHYFQEGIAKLFWNKFTVVYVDEYQEANVTGEATIYSSRSVIFQKLRVGFVFLIINSILKVIAIIVLFPGQQKYNYANHFRY